MNEKEQEVIDQILAKTKDVKVPDSLQPKQMEETLKHHNQFRKKMIKWNKKYTGMIAAACCLLVVGVAIVGKNGSIEKGNTEEGVITKQVATAKSYEEIYEHIEALMPKESMGKRGIDGAIAENDMATTLETKMDTGGASYSNTNVRQEGVDEGDYVKTDGKHLYILKENARELVIVDIQETQMKEIARIDIGKDLQASEFYFAENKLIILCIESASKEVPATDGSSVYNQFSENTKVLTYDVTKPNEPVEMNQTSQSGRYHSSRISGEYLYVFSQYYTQSDSTKDNIDGYIPMVQGKVLSEKNIYMPIINQANMYIVVTSTSINEPGEIIDSKAIFSQNDYCYVSNHNIYLYGTIYKEDGIYSQTGIRKIEYKDGQLKATAQGIIKGTINDSFSVDEHKGNLRVVTSISSVNRFPQPIARNSKIKETKEQEDPLEDTNALYVLNEELKTIGSIEGLAKDERVYSTRFMGDRGYFVTYRQTDPLFSVDLADPTNPTIVGELKIPGFSEYLHPYKDGLLLGIGQDMDEEGITSNGVKISMFDISDPNNVKEVHKEVIQGAYSTDAFYDYKAVLIDSTENIIGLSAHGEEETYYIYSYDDQNGFRNHMKSKVSGNSYRVTRGIYVRRDLYIVKGDIIEAYNRDNYQIVGNMILK